MKIMKQFDSDLSLTLLDCKENFCEIFDLIWNFLKHNRSKEMACSSVGTYINDLNYLLQ